MAKKQPTLDELLATIDDALAVLDDDDLPLEQAFKTYSGGLEALQAAHAVLAGYEERFAALQEQADSVLAELGEDDAATDDA